ncbi:MAG: hypothetical protein U9N57_00410 [Pseudomonadota bacterium]|nr:hypothetical protein [Pseudomonadota bacterium]
MRKTAQSYNLQKPNRLSRFISGLILLFVFSQTASLLHAEIHPFHEHEASCDVFDNLGHPLDSASDFSPQIASPGSLTPQSIQVRSVFESLYISNYWGRAPPLA